MLLIILLLNFSKRSPCRELLPQLNKWVYFHAKRVVTRLKAALMFRREQWLLIERADVLCTLTGMPNKAGNTMRSIFLKTAVYGSFAVNDVLYYGLSILVRFGYIHDGRCNFSVLSDTVLSPTAEAESFVTRDIWKTVFLNEALQQSNNDSADKKLPCHFCPFPVWKIMSVLVHIAPSCLSCTRETLASVLRRPMCFPFTLDYLFFIPTYSTSMVLLSSFFRHFGKICWVSVNATSCGVLYFACMYIYCTQSCFSEYLHLAKGLRAGLFPISLRNASKATYQQYLNWGF